MDLRVPGLDARLEPVKVWLPPQYFEASHKDDRFPVLVGIGAMHSTGESFIKTSAALSVARTAITRGRAKPFIGVYLPSRIDFDVDSECVDLPGLASQSFYTQQVVQVVQRSFATVAPGKGWYTEGYSTGGQCAALLQARHSEEFTASVNMAGYFTPMYDAAGARLATPELTRQNSPLAMVRKGQLTRYDLLSIASRKDKASWGTPGAQAPFGEGDGAQFHAAAKGLAGVEFVMADTLGHHAEQYLPYWTTAIDWLGARGL